MVASERERRERSLLPDAGTTRHTMEQHENLESDRETARLD